MSAVFTPEMKQTHTILIPDMLPIHFGLIMEIFRNNGYKMELLTTSTRSVVDEGGRNVVIILLFQKSMYYFLNKKIPTNIY